jgi:mono/diheme cytochrome c family protein
MPKSLLALSALLLIPPFPKTSSAAWEKPHPMAAVLHAALVQAASAGVPATAAAPTPPDTKNPVRATAETRARAKKMYGYDCAMCHGENGDGKTDLAADMGPGLTDLTDPKTLAGKSDAEIFDIIKNGKGKMPPEDLTRAKLDDLWSLVIYVRGLAKK